MSEFKDPNLEIDGGTPTTPKKPNFSQELSVTEVISCNDFTEVQNSLDVTITVFPVNEPKMTFSIAPGDAKLLNLQVPCSPKSKEAAEYLQVKVSDDQTYWIWADDEGILIWSVKLEPSNAQPMQILKTLAAKKRILRVVRKAGAPWIVGEVDAPEGNTKSNTASTL